MSYIVGLYTSSLMFDAAGWGPGLPRFSCPRATRVRKSFLVFKMKKTVSNFKSSFIFKKENKLLRCF